MNPIKHYRNNKRNLQFIKATLLSPARFINAVSSLISLRLAWICNPAHPVVVDMEPTNACYSEPAELVDSAEPGKQVIQLQDHP